MGSSSVAVSLAEGLLGVVAVRVGLERRMVQALLDGVARGCSETETLGL